MLFFNYSKVYKRLEIFLKNFFLFSTEFFNESENFMARFIKDLSNIFYSSI